MVHLRLPIRVLAHAPTDAMDDESCGERLAHLVRETIARKGSLNSAVAVAVRVQRTELLDLREVLEAGVALPMFLAGLSRSEPEGFGTPLAVGLAGRFQFRTRGNPGQPVGLAFLEWPDCRWWQWSVMLDSQGQMLPDSELYRRAVDGDPLPGGLGRWWTLGRRTRTTLRFGPVPGPALDSPLVH